MHHIKSVTLIHSCSGTELVPPPFPGFMSPSRVKYLQNRGTMLHKKINQLKNKLARMSPSNHTHTRARAHTHTRARAHTHTQTHKHTNTHTHTHTRMQSEQYVTKHVAQGNPC